MANLSPGFPSDSFKHRPEGTIDDFSTGTGSYANDKPFSNTPPWGTQRGIANHKGVFISCDFQGMEWILKLLIISKFLTSDNGILAF